MRRPSVSTLVLGALALGLLALLGVFALRDIGERRAPIVHHINELVAGFEQSPQAGAASIQSHARPARRAQPLAAFAALVAVCTVWYGLHHQQRSRKRRS